MPVFPKTSRPIFHTYSETVTVTSGAATAGTYVYATNGLYDCNITSTGHQPMGFDQMMLFYNHYCVMRSKIVVTFKNFSATYASHVSISLNGSSTPITNYDQLMEDGFIVHTVLTPKFNTGYEKTLRKGCDIARFAGVDKLRDRDDYQGDASANPAELSYFHISVWNPDDTTVVSATCTVLMEFEAVYLEPRKLTQS